MAESEMTTAQLKAELCKCRKLLEKYEHKEREQAKTTLYKSGVGYLAQHLGADDEIILDNWFPVYEKEGLTGLKKKLRDDSKAFHNNKKACSECARFIKEIHD